MRGYPDHFYGPRLIGGGLSFLMILLILGLLVYLVLLLRRDRDGAVATRSHPAAPAEPPPPPPANTPIEVAKMRYARGEITREEYETIRRDLE